MQNPIDSNGEMQSLLETYSKTVLSVAYGYVKNMADAEDIAQDVFISLVESKVRFNNSEHEKAYIIRTTMNRCKNFLRAAQIRRVVPLEDNLTTSMPEEQGELLSAVLSLPVKYRTVIHLYYYENYSIKEIAEITHKNAATIGTLLARGRKLLKEALKGGESDA
ncbi:MAG: sigma-70 family RNA polymerase sigma factor [Massiliimalia sp.]|jgi:RNA polymerase sigma factor (sigma-70 family)